MVWGPHEPTPEARESERPTTPLSDSVPARIAQYPVECELGRGGMGVVYLARDPRLDRHVAIKVLSPQRATGEFLGRFEQEARMAAQLNHPNIATVYELGEVEETCYIAMEFVEGRTLRELMLRPEPLPLDEALAMAIQMAEGLTAAHEKGIVHHDLKPRNVMLTSGGRVKILDFGIARSFGRDASVSAERLVLGTPGYMAPEQIAGEPGDARSDVFSFGVVLYELVTGAPPFLGGSETDIIAATVRGSLRPIQEVNPGAPPELARIISRCLSSDRAGRYPSSAELLAELRAVARVVAEPGGTAMPSVAVLPFANLSPDAETDYFADGMATEIITALSRIEALRVVSRTSTFAFKGRDMDVRAIGGQLDVQSVLEGSVRKADGHLRITARLVSVADGFQLWSQRYDRDLKDIFAIQDEIARNITRALRVVLTDEEERAISRMPTSELEAYDYYLRGRQFFFQRGKSYELAVRMFERAIEIDPGFALAYAGIAEACSMLYMWWDHSEANLQEAGASSATALDLDPHLAEAHVARGLAVSLKGGFDAARSHFETAIRLDPQLYEAHYYYGRACFAGGELDRAANHLEQACRLRPEEYLAPTLVALVYKEAGRTADAESASRHALELTRKQLELNPGDARALSFGATRLATFGEHSAALEWAQRAIDIDPQEPSVVYNVACVYAILGRADEALDLLEQVIARGFGHRAWVERDPDWRPLREHPRFRMLLEKL
ncbi:MAG: protein kinase domain-containing protein [Planctomycetota bacterium]